MVWYSLFVSFGFSGLYAGTAYIQTHRFELAAIIGALAFVAFLVSFLFPLRLYKFTNADVAPQAQTQVISRAAVSSAITFALNIVVWFVLGRSVPLIEELYMYTLITIFIFHGWAGAIASHVVYLQQTKQYNSNQLVAVIAMVTLILFVLILYFITLDWAIPRDAYIHLRDLTLITLVLVGFGRAVYLMAHH
ncbi:MAG: hypothetical protein HZB51_05025 [Chloroflexi bacterium]|nr:hypothetical protein [Chloroflexota bacterium]